MREKETEHARTLELRTLLVVYGAALCAGLSVVSFPGSANQLKQAHAITDAAYGAIFLPQLACTIAGSMLGGAWATRRGLSWVLRLALAALALGELTLAASARLDASAYAALLVASGVVGFGFGLSAAPLNSYPGLLLPRRAQSALVALHTCMGAGFAFGPLLLSAGERHGLWWLGVSAIALAALMLAAAAPRTPERREARPPASAAAGPALAPFIAIAVLYACAEGTLANWASVYLHEERGLSERSAALALSTFWAALVLGRLVVSAILLRVPAKRVWLTLPAAIALSFLLLPTAHDTLSGTLLFALAGASCGAFFPLTVGQAVAETGAGAARVSSALTAALMVGSGLASFAIGPLRGGLRLETIYVASSAYPVLAGLLAFWAARRRQTRAGSIATTGGGCTCP